MVEGQEGPRFRSFYMLVGGSSCVCMVLSGYSDFLRCDWYVQLLEDKSVCVHGCLPVILLPLPIVALRWT